jgi:hypothetical protein
MEEMWPKSNQKVALVTSCTAPVIFRSATVCTAGMDEIIERLAEWELLDERRDDFSIRYEDDSIKSNDDSSFAASYDSSKEDPGTPKVLLVPWGSFRHKRSELATFFDEDIISASSLTESGTSSWESTTVGSATTVESMTMMSEESSCLYEV